MRAGKFLRESRALEAAGAKPCESCGHPIGRHFELRPSTFAVDYGSDPPGLLEVANPDYRPLDFHCDVDGCECVRRPQ